MKIKAQVAATMPDLGFFVSVRVVEPRRFELLTSCLQIGRISGCTGYELGGGLPASDRDCPLLTALNGPLMARWSSAPQGRPVRLSGSPWFPGAGRGDRHVRGTCSTR
ncbi:hypothetical protein GCM10017559_22700 [Streptosporangium longisporum]|uniref:Uncharacterized protein n=1 Tax=Streptosporangium longisporum TaxID=46187 RepID=A0ABP6KCI3_9ACTN